MKSIYTPHGHPTETHRPSWDGVQVPSYLDEVITPAYDLLAAQLAHIGHGVIDHSNVRNYDDFNEIFWQESCLSFTVTTMFEGATLKKRCVCSAEQRIFGSPI